MTLSLEDRTKLRERCAEVKAFGMAYDAVEIAVALELLDTLEAAELESSEKSERIGHWVKRLEAAERANAVMVEALKRITLMHVFDSGDTRETVGNRYAAAQQIAKESIRSTTSQTTALPLQHCPACHAEFYDLAGRNCQEYVCPMSGGVTAPDAGEGSAEDATARAEGMGSGSPTKEGAPTCPTGT